ncbi:MAG TPA: hypothetical protein VFQ44_17250 [Streptosporangiaceae bacterium]|nr:hypothetical protein [Streptosporangiaceae bacterium]
MPQITSYPTGRAYLDALFNTRICFRDPALAGGEVSLDSLGLPKPISGASASVFTIAGTDGRRWAVKCFTRFIPDQELRYQRISEALRKVDKSWRVEFSYLQDGIMVQGTRYPVLKMEWVEASSLISFIEGNLSNAATLAGLAGEFAAMVSELTAFGIAHGDLQHGNLLVTRSGELKLIDYDGMFVPGLAQLGACEIGHANYQSPARSMSTWGPYLDHFSAWIIYSSLLALSIEPGLWQLLREPGGESLLFHRDDFADFDASRVFNAFSHSAQPELRAVGAALGGLWTSDLTAIPPLDPALLPELRLMSGRPSRQVPAQIAETQPVAVANHPDSSWVTGHLPPLPLVPFTPPRLAGRLLTGVMVLFAIAAVASVAAGLLPYYLGGSAVFLAVAVFFAASGIMFRQIPEWHDKYEKAVICRQRRIESRDAARQVSKLQAARTDLDNREKKATDKVTKDAAKARASEQAEFSKLGTDLARQVQAINRQRQQLQTAEQRELSTALVNLQRQHVRAFLARVSLNSAKISGIGPAVVRSLAACGIHSAADFTGIEFRTGPRGGQQVYLRRADGLPVHPNGVGEKKARDLDTWRQGIERQARASQPATLPADSARTITTRYSQQRQALADQQKAAEAQHAHQHGQVAQKWAPIHASLSAELTAKHKQAAEERAKLDGEISVARKQADAVTWQGDLAERQLAAYRDVSYLRYLAKIISV